MWGAVLQYDGQVGVSPVGGPGYRDLFPERPDPASVLDCATGGVLPSVCGVIGSIMAAQVVTLLTGIGESLVGRVTTYDARSGRFRELTYRHDPSAAPITALADDTPGNDSPGDDSPGDDDDDEVGTDELTAPQLAELLAEAAPPLLLDVREPWEHELAAIAGSQLLPLGQLADGIADLPRDRRIVAYCHHGIRSRHALDLLRAAGLDAQHLVGGIDAWSVQVDPDLARY